jgi:hypothetical protein
MVKANKGSRPVKVPTTPEVVRNVQSITAKKFGGKQAPWVSGLQRTVDCKVGNSDGK